MSILSRVLMFLGVMVLTWSVMGTAKHERSLRQQVQMQAGLIELYRSNATPETIAESEENIEAYRLATSSDLWPRSLAPFFVGAVLAIAVIGLASRFRGEPKQVLRQVVSDR